MGKVITIEKQEISQLHLSIIDGGWADITDAETFNKVALAFIKEKQEYVLDEVDFQLVDIFIDFVPYKVSGEWIKGYIEPKITACEIPQQWT